MYRIIQNMKRLYKILFSYLKKIFSAKRGGIFLLSAIVSFFPVLYIMAGQRVPIETNEIKVDNQLTIAFRVLFEGANLKYIYLPILFEIVAFFIFTLLTLINLFSGLQAAKIIYIKSRCMQENCKQSSIKTSDWLNKDKLWNTFWKYVSTLFVTTLMIILCISCEIGGYSWGYGISIWFLFVLWLLACGFEFISIGDNIEIKTGTKPRIFRLYETLVEKLAKKTTDKIENITKE